MFTSKVQIGLVWLGLIPLFLWPAFANHGPIWFPDSLSYLSSANSAFELFFNWNSGDFGEGALTGDAIQNEQDLVPQNTPYAGRSIYFGAVMFVLINVFGLWGNIVFQSGLFVAVMLATILPFVQGRPAGVLFVAAIVGLFTAAPFFTAFLMPDYLAGLTILATIRLLGIPTKLKIGDAFIWWVVLVFAVVSHTSHMVLAIGLLLVSTLVFWLAKLQWNWQHAASVFGAIMVAILCEALFSNVVEKVYGVQPLRPPFLSARMIDDGPGHTYLRESCPASGYELCEHLERLPQYSDDFLWSRDENKGVYSLADTAAKSKLSYEQFDFAFAVLLHHPIEQLVASSKRFLEQLRWFGLEEFQYHQGLRDDLQNRWSGKTLKAIEKTEFFQGSLLTKNMDPVTKTVVLLSILHIFYNSFLSRSKNASVHNETEHMLNVFIVLVVLGIAGNAAISGILSTPHARYQARVIWLIPMISGILIWRNAIFPLLRPEQMRQKN